MSNDKPQVSASFEAFMTEAKGHAEAFMGGVMKLGEASALDQKTGELAYIAVLAAVRMESGIPFHVKMAKLAGATRDEVISAVLLGLPATGLQVTQVLPAAIEAYDAE